MKTLILLSVLCAGALGFRGYSRLPQRTVMFGGYYGRPRDFPEGSMSFASGDTIATNSFLAEPEETTQRRIYNHDEDIEIERPTPKPKRIPTKKPTNEEEDSEEDDSSHSAWPFGGSRNGAPAYNAFFPIMIGGMPGLGRRGGGGDGGSNGEGYYPGAATAIANSFSTGKGGVATSHATSFGDPYLSTLFRNGGKKGVTEN